MLMLNKFQRVVSEIILNIFLARTNKQQLFVTSSQQVISLELINCSSSIDYSKSKHKSAKGV